MPMWVIAPYMSSPSSPPKRSARAGVLSVPLSIAEQGERAAEQATMALDSLFIAYTKNGRMGNEQQIRNTIKGLFQQLEDPSAYNGFKFAQEMKTLSSLL